MHKVISVQQMRQVDADCIVAKNIFSIELMERAARAFTGVFCGLIPEKTQSILILCGTGNNGGDGLAIARLLQCSGYSSVRVLIFATGGKESSDFLINLQRLESTPVITSYFQAGDVPRISETILIDAILGSGVNRPLAGQLKQLVDELNHLQKHIVAVDCPTGFRCEGELNKEETVLKVSDVISFQRPKLNFFFPESVNYLERFHVVDIGLREEFIESLPSDFYLIGSRDVSNTYKKRKAFSHKGTYGHAFIWAGGEGKSGAALLCAEACIYSGAGLTSVHLPQNDRFALLSRLPEAMFKSSLGEIANSKQHDLSRLSAVAIGPGLDDNGLEDTIKAVIEAVHTPIVIDAEGVNYLAKSPDLLNKFRSSRVILTPHMKEFDRLFGESPSWWARVQLAIAKAKEYRITIVLKNQYTFIILSDGRVLINPTGNPAMASGGMGDALTGIIVSFLAQDYNPEDACILGCYLHGKAGDLLAANGNAVIPATHLIAQLPFVIGEIE